MDASPPNDVPATSRYIAIEGPIGVGKTTLCHLLAKHYQARTVLEEFDENPFLREFYRDRESAAFQTQIYFLLARYKQQEQLLQEDLFKRSMISDYLFAKDRVFAYLNLSAPELVLYEKIYELLVPRLVKPDVTIYLTAEVDVLLARINKRGRDYETTVEREYLSGLANGFHHFFQSYEDSPLLIVNSADLDIVNRPQDLAQIIKLIDTPFTGIKRL